jgi:hypothetical protein
MTMHNTATASLIVALSLLAFAGLAKVILARPDEDPRARRYASAYLEPLCTWCLLALAVHVLALIGDDTAGGLSFALTLVLAAGAVMLRPWETTEPVAAEPVVTAPEPDPQPRPGPPPTPVAVGGTLWATRPLDDEATRRAGLWRR